MKNLVKINNAVITNLAKIFTFLLLYLIIFSAYAANNSDKSVTQLITSVQTFSLQQRIVVLSQTLLSKPYQLEPLGEGATGEFSRKPLYRLDVFDCQTYVEMVMALALAKNLSEFKRIINQIRYQAGSVSFQHRNHFISKDWMPNNEQLGFVKDITCDLVDNLAQTSTITITPQSWYQHLTEARIARPDLTAAQRKEKLRQLHSQVVGQAVVSGINFIPVDVLLNQSSIVDKISSGSIIFLVFENANQKQLIGTDNNISHMGLAVWRNGQLYLRHASSMHKRVVDELFVSYLSTYLSSSGLKGISVWKITRPQSSYFSVELNLSE